MTETPAAADALRVALLNDHEVVVLGLAELLLPFAARLRVVELASSLPVASTVDLTLYDAFHQPTLDTEAIDEVIARAGAGRVVVYTWNLQPELVQLALGKGVSGYLSKKLGGAELVEALERVDRGEIVVSSDEPVDGLEHGRWPGQEHGLTAREAEVVALITSGLSNIEVAHETYLSINSVKSYIRSAYRKMDVTSRSQAVLWGVQRGFLRDVKRVQLPPTGGH